MQPSQSYLDRFESECTEFRESGYSFFGLHQDSIVISVSDEAVNELGYSIDEFLGMNSWLLFDTSSFQEVAAKLFQFDSTEYDAVMKRKDGSIFKVHLNIVHTKLENEAVRLVFYKLI